jgi:cytochrome c biogenesis protein CcmG/thiol:disulfide interchange protein DsbE
MAGRAKLILQAAAVSVVALLVVLLAWQVFKADEGRALSDQIAAGKRPPAPDFELELLDGSGTLRLSDLRGKVVVLNFWASWCDPCKEEASVLQAAWERWRDEGVVVVGVDAQDFKSDARRFAARYGVTYPSVYDGKGSTLGRFGVTGFPETYFVDRQGRLVGERVQGPLTEERLNRNIEVALRS